MKKLLTILCALALAGCTTNGQIDYGKTAMVVVGVAVVGAVAANSGGSSDSGPDCYVAVTSTGSDRVCR